MDSFSLKDIGNYISGNFYGNIEPLFTKIITDSRKISKFENSLFVALRGTQHDGHTFIPDLYKNGVRSFVISTKINIAKYSEAAFFVVSDTTLALQEIASWKRNQFDIPIIGITGSNGKTIVKEWLYHLLSADFNITRSPKSYNSQTGVPLSLWLLNSKSELGIIEAGISQVGEMEKLAKIVKPSIGILTNIGTAHQANFKSFEEKVEEKIKLFYESNSIVYNTDCKISVSAISKLENKNLISWSEKNQGQVNVVKVESENNTSKLFLRVNKIDYHIEIPFTDQGSIQNAITCFCGLIALNIDIQEKHLARFSNLPGVKMRLETIDATQNSILINDSYNSDINSLEIALDYLNQKNGNKETVLIMSDILQSSDNKTQLYKSVSKLISEKKISKFIGIGSTLLENKNLFKENSEFYSTTQEFLNNTGFSIFHNKAILLKGARSFKFEEISKKLQSKSHETVVETDLNLMRTNLQYFKSIIKPETKVMAMVKAFSYGSGYREISAFMQHNRIDYLAVAYTDEGVELRNCGITTPILVMNPAVQAFKTMIEYNLEPEIYSISLLQSFIKELSHNKTENFPIHIKINTGMNRLGFNKNDIEDLCELVNTSDSISIKSIFSHLSASDSDSYNDFTHQQVSLFNTVYDKISKSTNSKPERHVLNSAGTIRFPEYQYEMVRLGIGLYGLMPDISDELIPVSKFKSTISQIHKVSKGDSVSYMRSGIIEKDSVTATIPVGYADGLNRKLGNGNWYLMVNSKKAYTVGNICMDMCMIDISEIDAKEGDEVIIFGPENTINEMANQLGTISYEVVSCISQRVKRVYVEE